MKTIWKFELMITDMQLVGLPEGAIIRSCGLDPQGTLCLWVEVEPTNPIKPRKIFIVGTGHPVPKKAVHFIGSVKQEMYMWHLYSKHQ